MRCPRGYFFAAEIEIPEKVEVFRSETHRPSLPTRYTSKQSTRRSIPVGWFGGRWVFGRNGRGYYVKDETLSAFKIEPRITPYLQVSANPSEEPLKLRFPF
jgi:hypothetical protein